MQGVTARRRKSYLRKYFKSVRQRRYPKHEFVKTTHCRDCLNAYMRNYYEKWLKKPGL